jgi:hypothetical protein
MVINWECAQHNRRRIHMYTILASTCELVLLRYRDTIDSFYVSSGRLTVNCQCLSICITHRRPPPGNDYCQQIEELPIKEHGMKALVRSGSTWRGKLTSVTGKWIIQDSRLHQEPVVLAETPVPSKHYVCGRHQSS